MLCALIMAGGKGTRFWPLSTEEKPKQFLNLIGNETMIQMTVNRIKPIIPLDRIFICTGSKYVDLVRKQLPNLPYRNIIVEPEGRNTAPCIALSAQVIKRYYNDATMVVLAADHLINKEDTFRDIISEAEVFLKDNNDAIITLGMNPTRPETGYGYIKEGLSSQKINNCMIKNVEAFVEKPNIDLANKYLKEGNYLWNGGMFVWKIDSILNKIREYLPRTYDALKDIDTIDEDKLQDCINNNYKNTDTISIDYGILEKDNNIFVMPSNIDWDDIGTWKAIERYRDKDGNGNILSENVRTYDATGVTSLNNSKNMYIIGVDDIMTVETEEAVYIVNKNYVDKLKELQNLI